MTKHIAEVTASWQDGQVLDVLSEMMTLTARTAVETMFSDALPFAVLGAVLNDFNILLASIYARVLIPPPLDKLLVVGNRRYDRARVRLRKIIGRVIIDRRASDTDRGDLLSTLLSARDPVDSQGLSDTEIVDQPITFFFAGSETTANTLAWAVHVLARHPEASSARRGGTDDVLCVSSLPYASIEVRSETGGEASALLRVLAGGWHADVDKTICSWPVGGSKPPSGGLQVMDDPHVGLPV